MKIFIGKISSSLDSDTVYDHFATYGEIEHFNFKNQFAFVEYKNENDANKVLDKREIEIKGTTVIVEASNSRPRSRGDFNDEPRRDYNDAPRRDFNDPPRRDFNDPPRRDFNDLPRRDFNDAPRYDDRPPRRDFNDAPSYRRDDSRAPRYDDRPQRYGDQRGSDSYAPSNGGYESRGEYARDDYNKPLSRDDYNKPSSKSDRDDCFHCSKCEIHGNPRYAKQDSYEHKRPRREHPNNINKIVIQTIPQEADLQDVDDLVKKNEFEFVFSRLTIKRDAAIVEFRDIETRDKAIAKLDGQELKGVTIRVREFRTGGNSQGAQTSFNDRNNGQFDSNNNKNDEPYGNSAAPKDDSWGNSAAPKDDSWGNSAAPKDDSWRNTDAPKDDNWGKKEDGKDDNWGTTPAADNQGVDIYSGLDK